MSEQAPQRLSARTAIVGTDTPIARVLPQAERRTIGWSSTTTWFMSTP